MRILLFAVIFSRITFCQAALNDDFRNRIALSGSTIEVAADNSGATLEPGEPTQPESAGSSLWWSWVAPADGWLTVDTSSNIFTPFFGAYTGSLLSNLTLVARSDVRCPRFDWSSLPAITTNEIFHVSANQTYQFAFSSPLNPYDSFTADQAPRGPFRFSLVFSTVEIMSPTNSQRVFTGTNIQIDVGFHDAPDSVSDVALELDDALQTVSGTASSADPGHRYFQIPPLPAGPHTIRARLTHSDNLVHWSPRVTFSVGPPNDDVKNAILVVGTNVTIRGDVANATAESGELFNPRSDGSTIWYRWVAASKGIARIAVSSDFLTVTVQRRNSAGQFELVAINYPKETFYDYSRLFPVLQFAADNSVEYYIQISDMSVMQPVGFFSICESPRPVYPRPFSFTLDLVQGIARTPELLIKPGLPFISSDAALFLLAAAANSHYTIYRSTNLVEFETAFEGIASGGCEYVSVPADLNAASAFYFLRVNP